MTRRIGQFKTALKIFSIQSFDQWRHVIRHEPVRSFNRLDDRRECCVVTSVERVEVELGACLDIGWIDVHERLIVECESLYHRSAVEIRDGDLVGHVSDGG